jgi:hypothetical protein
MARTAFSNPGDPPSPCIKICKLDPVTRLCTGCLRSTDEIGAWSFMSPDEKRDVIAQLPGRRAGRRSRRG